MARPSVEADAVHVATLADFVLIPTRPAIFDLRAILGTLDIVKGTAHRSLIVLNACRQRAGQGRPRLSPMLVAPWPRSACLWRRSIINRAAFAAAAVSGLTAAELEPHSKAAKEMRTLWRAEEQELSHEKTDARKRTGKEGAAGAGARALAGE